MADSSIAITAGSGTNVDTRTEPVNGDHRQVIVLGDGAAAATATVSAAGALLVAPAQAGTAIRTVVTATGADQELLAANTSRIGFTVYNNSGATLYLGLGSATVTANDCTLVVAGGGYYEAPFGYRGAVRGLWSVAAGAANVTELT